MALLTPAFSSPAPVPMQRFLLLHSEVVVHSAGEKETVPLSIHHLPFALTFAFFGVRPAHLRDASHQRPHTQECMGVCTPGRSSVMNLGAANSRRPIMRLGTG